MERFEPGTPENGAAATSEGPNQIIRRLSKTPKKHQSDDNLRNLAEAYQAINQKLKGIAALNAIRDKTAGDYAFLAQLHREMGHLKAARRILEERITTTDDAHLRYLLACTYTDPERNNPYLSREDVPEIKKHLERSILLGSPPPDAYSWLAELLGHGADSAPQRAEILKTALLHYPEHWNLRESLCRTYLNRLDSPKQALELLEQPDVEKTPVALWLIADCHLTLSHYDEALRCFNAIPPEKIESRWLPKLRGDMLLHKGLLSEAIAEFNELISSQDPAAQVIGHLSRAYVRLQQERLDAVAADIHRAIDITFNDGVDWIGSYIDVGDDHEHYDLEALAIRVLEAALQDRNILEDSLTDDLRGRILYRLWNARQCRGTDVDHLLEQALALTQHPVLSQYRENDCLRNKQYAEALRHFLKYARWVLTFQSETEFRNRFAPQLSSQEIPEKKEDFIELHHLLLNELKQCDDDNERQVLFRLVYKEYWRRCLLASKLYRELHEAADAFLTHGRSDQYMLFESGYALYFFDLNQSEKVYRELVALAPQDAGALGNLSLILKQKGTLDEAMQFAREAARIDPKLDHRINEIKDAIAEQREEQREHDRLQTARDRWPQLDSYKRRLMGVLTVISGFKGWADLAELSGIDEKYLAGHWRKLVELGMILENKDGKYEVNQHIRPLAEKERTHGVTTTLVRADNSIAFKPIFNSQTEHQIYKVLLELFPNHLVFPNMSLQTVFQFDRMKGLVDQSEFQYYLNSQVDFCITSTASYLPLIAFEVDSIYHDSTSQIERDRKKNKIFQVGGISLIRLRPHGRPGEMAVREEIVTSIRTLGTEFQRAGEKHTILRSLLKEIDFDNFGKDAPNTMDR